VISDELQFPNLRFKKLRRAVAETVELNTRRKLAHFSQFIRTSHPESFAGLKPSLNTSSPGYCFRMTLVAFLGTCSK